MMIIPVSWNTLTKKQVTESTQHYLKVKAFKNISVSHTHTKLVLYTNDITIGICKKVSLTFFYQLKMLLIPSNLLIPIILKHFYC